MRARNRRDHQRSDADHVRVLGMLQAAGESPLSLAALEHAGVRNPATIVYELELRGYLIDHVTGVAADGAGFRLDGFAEGATADIDGAGATRSGTRRDRARHARAVGAR